MSNGRVSGDRSKSSHTRSQSVDAAAVLPRQETALSADVTSSFETVSVFDCWIKVTGWRLA